MAARVDVLGSILGAITEAEADGYTETAEILCATHDAVAELIAALLAVRAIADDGTATIYEKIKVEVRLDAALAAVQP